jgi:hypothetical protein
VGFLDSAKAERIGNGSLQGNQKAKQNHNMTNPSKALAQAAIQYAAQGAREYIQRRDLAADPQRLFDLVKEEVGKALPDALIDADKAIQCGMGRIGEIILGHSMVLAGIEGAKKACAEYAQEHAEPVKVEYQATNLQDFRSN